MTTSVCLCLSVCAHISETTLRIAFLLVGVMSISVCLCVCVSVCERISETTLHLTFLLVEREVSNVDGARALVDSDSDQILTYLLARALVDGGRDPQHVAMVEDDHIGLVRHFVLAVGTAPTEIDVTGSSAISE